MRSDTPRSWPEELAAYLKISLPTAHALLTAGRLPDQTVRDAKILGVFNDATCCALLEPYRPQFDTAAEAFAEDLRDLARQLLEGQEQRNAHEALAGFHSFDYGRDCRYYPVTTHKKPWRRHRVPITLAAIEAAGYCELAALWSRGQDPLRLIAVVGELPLVGPGYRSVFNPRAEQRAARAAFLARLVEMLS